MSDLESEKRSSKGKSIPAPSRTNIRTRKKVAAKPEAPVAVEAAQPYAADPGKLTAAAPRNPLAAAPPNPFAGEPRGHLASERRKPLVAESGKPLAAETGKPLAAETGKPAAAATRQSLSVPGSAARAVSETRRPTVSPTINYEERHRLIAEAAYLRAERRGFRGGSPENDWYEAAAEIDAWLPRQGNGNGK